MDPDALSSKVLGWD
jgi:hypothetical protein